ncbi:hypothetical protein [[Mycobacterium] wendilense]|uniref:Uncharacterized protein n=1 Tax=[Mycobacterium] wendilense TaxID=3064284 RepID=A0ABN9NVK2_9MYCO|nr:hypothetical protein [Mycolicibacterium sp. MU0050]CAJ1580598.1 hypothetical protein MU0050_001123 [Mycolicibacterium sp. MU0050]
MSQTRNLFATTALVVGSTVALTFGGVASAEPAAPAPLPIDGLQAPGLSAMESLSPAIQQAAGDPSNAAQMLMAAAAAFTQNSDAPMETHNLAAAVSQFVSDPPGAATPVAHGPAAGVPHNPPAGVVPGAAAHLPPGVDPAHAVGPALDAVPAAAPAPAPEAAVPAPEAAVPAPEAPAPAPAGSAFGPDAPVKQDFLYPSIGNGCLADGGNAIATAISVAGPAKIPTPGPGPGQTAYVFTAVGTSGPADEQKLPLNVTWVNLTTGKSGSATLTPRDDINPEGPTTLTAIADTGSGSIMSTIFGQVTTTEKQCQFMPTIGSTVVP